MLNNSSLTLFLVILNSHPTWAENNRAGTIWHAIRIKNTKHTPAQLAFRIFSFSAAVRDRRHADLLNQPGCGPCMKESHIGEKGLQGGLHLWSISARSHYAIPAIPVFVHHRISLRHIYRICPQCRKMSKGC